MLFTGIVLAQSPDNVVDYLKQCRGIDQEKARLACYDTIIDQAGLNSPARNNTQTLREENRRILEEMDLLRRQQGSTQSSSRVEEFGRQSAKVIETDGREELYDRIARLDRTNSGWLITLEQGQVWRQVISKRFNLKEGHEVRIYPTNWGDSYRLSVVDGPVGYIQVERIQ